MAPKKGTRAWNKGIPMTEEAKANLRETKRLHPHPSPFLGKHHTEEAKEKLRRAGIGRRSWCKGLTAKTDSRLAVAGRKIFGEKNPQWNGGCRKTLQNYAFTAWEKAYGPFPKAMVLHHIDGNPSNNTIENLACITWSEHERLHNRNPNHDPRTKRFVKLTEKERDDEVA